MKVAILGTGYVGLTTGICLAYTGHKVTCIDPVREKIELLERGGIPIYEPHLEELATRARPNLCFTTRYEEGIPDADVVFIAVGTPPSADGSPDLRYLRAAAEGIGQTYKGDFAVIVNKSTVPIGSANWTGSILRDALGEDRFSVASNPEFLREGSAIHDTLYPDRIVIGSDNPRALETLYTLYRPILDQTFPVPPFLPRPDSFGAVPLVSTDLASAELIKYAANAFLALKISYINEIGRLAEHVGADIRQVAKGIGLDSRIGMRFLQAGIGWGGSCFGKDTSALMATAREYGLAMPIVEAAREVNARQRDRVVEKLLAEFKILKGRTVGLMGLAFKPHTDDLREAPAIDIAQRLIERGCRVKAHDPVGMDRFRREYPGLDVTLAEGMEELAKGCDALVLVTEWPQYLDSDWERIGSLMRTRTILDGRHALDPVTLERAGFRRLTVCG
jgi:UDPglucose 6-dehydrogenase